MSKRVHGGADGGAYAHLAHGGMTEEEIRKTYSGMWHVMHMLAAKAITDESMRSFKFLIKCYCDSFPCLQCRKHLVDYVSKNPLSKYVSNVNESGRPIGMATWSWAFHNAVNTRLGKPYMDWDIFERMWLKDDFDVPECTKSCGS